MDIKEKIKGLIVDSLKDLDIKAEDIILEHPADLTNGDYSTNVAFVSMRNLAIALDNHTGEINLARKDLGMPKTPKDLAEKIIEELNKNLSKEISKVEVAGAGFINFYLSREFFTETINKILEEKTNWGKADIHKNKRILVEHSSPNLFKPFHIGHVMNETIGESISRLAKFSGAKVEVISFPSDISLGIAKAIFILLEKIKLGSIDVDNEIVEYGNAYVEGTKRYDEDESIHSRVKEISDNLYLEKPSDEWNLFVRCKAINMSYFEKITAIFGSKFNGYIFESDAGVVGKEMVLKYTPSIFTKSEGAIVYIPEESKKYINTAVFINSQGNPTYEAKDLGLLNIKFTKYNPDLSIYITDHQQISHFAVVLDATEKINKDWVEKSIHRTHGRMTFKGKKMSSRLGGVPLAKDLLDFVVEDVKNKSKDLSEKDYYCIAVSALKFTILRAMAGKNINFDPDTSLSFEGDSGPYLQYSTVRARSVLEKANNLKYRIEKCVSSENKETDFEKMVCRFPDIVNRAIEEWAPHHLVSYLLELARMFNSWYGNTKIINEENKDMLYNIAITKAFEQTMRNGLYLLGIETPERM
jgi:arginyl-tRNA synthetase